MCISSTTRGVCSGFAFFVRHVHGCGFHSCLALHFPRSSCGFLFTCCVLQEASTAPTRKSCPENVSKRRGDGTLTVYSWSTMHRDGRFRHGVLMQFCRFVCPSFLSHPSRRGVVSRVVVWIH
ncbi:unnamed protein product [Ascophyllum nodosum]